MREPPDWRQVAAGYDRAATGYDARHGDARSRARFRIIERPMVRATQGAQRVLELGCGTGRLLGQVHAPMRVGIDVSLPMLEQARSRIEHLALADAHVLPFAGHSFDAVIAGKGVFRYLDYGRAFAECARVLSPGGRLAVHQYAARTWSVRDLWPGRQHVENKLEVTDLAELHRLARRAGLAVMRTYLWRSIRVPPYALPIPVHAPGKWWSHCVVVFERCPD